uniref:LTD domain-containing protein n=1 Tax=Trichobilharzia regenti TaxID=157069 RepID=A0AA85KC61_TRIRE|nr:unnamed protein product [Trichobilharzia regenti]
MNALNKSINSLEEDLKLLRTSYECQINHLTTTLSILMDEKRDLEDELLARKENDNHFMDRISIESSKNAKLLLDISALKSEVNEKAKENEALKMRLQELQMSSGDDELTRLKLTEEIDLLKQKLSLSEDLHTSTANQLQSALLKLNSQEKFAKEITTLQSQLLLERKENKLLKTKSLENDHKMLNFQQQIADLNSKVQSTEHQSELLRNSLDSLSRENGRLRSIYEKKIQDLEAIITSSASEVEYAHSNENNVLKEITRFKSILELEEERLNLFMPDKEVMTNDERDIKSERPKCLETDTSDSYEFCDGEITSRLDFALSPKVTLSSLIVKSNNEIHENSNITNIELQDENLNNNNNNNNTNNETRIDDENAVDKFFMLSELTDKRMSKSLNYQRSTSPLSKSPSNAIGCLQICEIDPNGRYLLLWNSSTSKELDIGLYKVWQKHGQEKINEFTFPSDTRMSPRTVFTLWSNSAPITSSMQNTRSEFRCPNVCKWMNSSNYITIVSNSYDEILAWLVPYTRCLTSRNDRDNSVKNRLSLGLNYTSNGKRDALMLSRQKSTSSSASSPNHSTSADTEDQTKLTGNSSQTTFYELTKRYSNGSINNTPVTPNNSNNNNNNSSNHFMTSRSSSKSKNLISIDPPKLFQSSTFLSDNNKIKNGYSHFPHFNFLRQSSR